MLSVIFTICALANPSLCQQHILPLHNVNELTCLSKGQSELARHVLPGWRLIRYGCTRT
jgi:hypothetical protein